MTQTHACPKCGTQLSPDAAHGLCPKCLLDAGFESEADDRAGNSPKPADAAEVETIPPRDQGEGGPSTPYRELLARQFPQLADLEVLGQGGMGVVYKARQRHLNRLVAVKILPTRFKDDPNFTERFAREAQALAQLNHPNIVHVHDFGQTEESYYFIMEYVDGVNLRSLIHDGKLTASEALKIVPQICEALQFAHDEGIVHRDIKPENILVDKRGRVKIADFGIAKLLRNEPSDLSLTGTGQLMGTLGYMAPEQLRQADAVDHRADIYSLGVVFYEMLTGQLPAGRFDAPSKKVQVSVELDEVVLRTLENEPVRRYQQASEVKTDVERVSSAAIEPSGTSHVNAAAAVVTSGALPPGRAQRLLAIAMSYVLLAVYGVAGIGFSIYGVASYAIASIDFWTFVSAGLIATAACVHWMIRLRRWYRQVAQTGTYQPPESSLPASSQLRQLPFIGVMIAICGLVFATAVVSLVVVLAIQPSGTTPAGTPILWEVIGFCLFMFIASLGPGLALWNQYRWIERGTPAMEEPQATWFDAGLLLLAIVCVAALVTLPLVRGTDAFNVLLLFTVINTPFGLGTLANRVMIRAARQAELRSSHRQ